MNIKLYRHKTLHTLRKDPIRKHLKPRVSPWVIKSLDRLELGRARALPSVHLRATQLKKPCSVQRTLQYIGTGSAQLARRNGRIARLPLPRAFSNGCQRKYRLKLGASINAYAPSQRPVFRVRPAAHLRRARRYYTVNSKFRGAYRRASFSRHTSAVWRRALLLRAVRAPRPPKRIYIRRRKWWMAKLSPQRLQPTVHLPRKIALRLATLRHRLNRSHPRGYAVREFYRWWTKGRPLRNRRRRGKRLFSGVFGHRRWRLERRDKFLLRRERRRYPLARKVLSRTLRAKSTLQVVRWEVTRSTRLSKSSLQLSSRVAAEYRAHQRIRYGARTLRETTERIVRALKSRAGRRRGIVKGAIKLVRGVPFVITSHTGLAGARRKKGSYDFGYGYGPRVDYLFHRVKKKTKALRISRAVAFAPQKSPYAALKVVLVGITSLNRAFTPRLQKRSPARTARALSLQRRLRAGSISPASASEQLFAVRTKAVKYLAASTKLFRNLALKTAITPSTRRVLPAMQAGARTPTTLSRFLAAPESAAIGFPQPNFLKKVTKPVGPLQISTTLQSHATLAQQRRRYAELRFYHRRPRTRLPGLAVTRMRRRKGGFVTFTRNSLKRPRTLSGREQLLLPPANTSSTLNVNYNIKKQVGLNALVASQQHEDDWPVFWKRPHTKANIKAINRVRRRHYAKQKRLFRRRQNRCSRERRVAFAQIAVVPVHGNHTAAASITRPASILTTISCAAFGGSLAPTANKAARNGFAKLQLRPRPRLHRKGVKCALVAQPRRTTRQLTPTASRVSEWNILSSRHNASAQRVQGLWQTRSVQKMLGAERALSAWSPQLSVRTRRAHSPRIKGVPRARRWLGFTAKRERRNLNAKLLARNIPQRRYTDYAPIKLQYYYGSVNSTGYARFRRVHRLHSTNSRWWRPNKVAVPFAHPFSRRALNAKRYRQLDLHRAHAPKYKAFERLMRDTRGISLHSKFPPRTIPWRNFRYPRPRRGKTPRTLRRWTFTILAGKTGRVAPASERLTVNRSAREIRSLEQYIANRNVWKDWRWLTLDKPASANSIGARLSDAVRAVPRSAWKALQEHSASPAAYAAAQKEILLNFGRWLRKDQALIAKPLPVAFEQARFFLGTLISAALKAGSHKIAASVSASTWHNTLRARAFDRRVANKATRFLRLRVLPRLGGLPAGGSVVQREYSGLYRRWLHGVEGVSKRTQLGYTPTVRSRYTANVAVVFGRRRARFPASGRRHKSYDSLLHAFAKKTAPARLRRAAVLRFKRVSPHLSGDFRENLLASNVLSGIGRRRALARNLSTAAYLSSPWRELLGYRAVTSAAPAVTRGSVGSKRRFTSLPTAVAFASHAARELRALSPYKHQMRVIRAGVLRRALRKRRRERCYIDLRYAALQRRLPKERASRPRNLHRAVKRRRAARIGPYSLYAVRTRAAIAGRWTLVHLGAVGPRRENLGLTPLPAVLPSGEHISVVSKRLLKDRRAFRGFVLPVNVSKRRKLRRQRRDTRKRCRASKRGRRASRVASIRNTKHWSERKDRRFRNIAFSHKRHGFVKKVAGALRSTFTLRYGAAPYERKLLERAPSIRLTRFAARARLGVAPLNTPQHGVPTTESLVTASSFTHRESAIRVRNKRKMAALRYRPQPLTSLLRRKRYFAAAIAENSARQERTIAKRLVSTVDQTPSITPLWFQKPAARVVKSALAKEKAALAEIAMKEGRFKITAQYVDSLTAFIPELMNYMLSRKIETGASRITYKTAKYLVRNIYWSLRVYLNVDPFDIRFFARDRQAAARVRLFESISDLSEAQKTEQRDRAVLRHRFQPGKVLLAPNTMRFRGDWLRAFFPARHALYQENPEDYGNFLFTTRRIRRLRIGPRGMDSWVTAHQLVNHETRARQLLNFRFSRSKPRFETVLQTTRRAPQVEYAPAVTVGASRSSFFVRNFSTYNWRSLALTSRWIHRKKRFVALETGWRTVSPLALVTGRNRAIPHVEARSRTDYVTTQWSSISNSLLDSRFARAKSPRSRQYLLRAQGNMRNTNKGEKLANLVFYKELTKRRFLSTNGGSPRWTRATRRTIAESLKGAPFRRPGNALQSVRVAYPTRRMQGTLQGDQPPLDGPKGVTRAHLRARASQSLAITKRLPTGQRPSTRRTAAGRTSRITYQKLLTVSSGAVTPTRQFVRMHRVRLGSARPRLYAPNVFSSKRFAFPAKLSKLSGSTFGVTKQFPVSRKAVSGPVSYFKVQAGRRIIRSAAFARVCGLYTKFYRQAPFETHRSGLWDRLSLRWMKKFRVGRYWLRDTGRWLRDPWLSEIVACDMSLRPDRLGGELRSRPQKVGEYVAEVDAKGRDIRRKNALKERHKFQPTALPLVKDPEIKKTNRILKKGPVSDRIVTRHRLGITRQARRKPVPTMRLANYEYRDVIREHKENKAKSLKQKEEEEAARVKEYWARKAKKLPPVRPRRLPLKHPANLWLPHVIWKEIQRRIRKFEWRESDEVFFRRGFRTAFQFYPNERRKTPWLEHLMYTRATYSTRLREFRRRQYPHEQKKFKWLQRVRKMLYPGRGARYIKWRRWPQLRRYNQKLHYSLFDLRDRGAARRHFKRLNGRTRPAISAFVSMSRGLTDRLDVTCFQMGVAPSIYWARIVTEFGLLRVNGLTVYDPAYRIKPADVVYPNWDTIARFQHYFKPHLNARDEYLRRNRASTAFYPTNMEYHSGIRAFVYKHAPDESDLRRSSRIKPAYFRWFKLDSV